MLETFNFKKDNKKENNLKEAYFSYFKNHSKSLILSAVLLFVNQNVAAQTENNIQKNKPQTELGKTDSLNRHYLEKYKSDFKSFQKIFEEKQISQKVNALKGKLGESIEGFLSLHNINQDIANYEKVKKNESSDNIFMGSSYMFATAGSNLSKAYNERWSPKKVENSELVFNLSSLPDITNEELQKYLVNKYPKGYIENAIDTIEYNSKTQEAEGGIVKIGEAENFGLNTLLSDSENQKSKITIYNSPLGMDKNIFYYILDHEVNHPNDWNNNKLLTSFDRIEMLSDFLGRVESSNRYKSDYVEEISLDNLVAHIKDVNEDQKSQTLLYIKTMEYFAEATKAYFSNPDEFKKNNLQDYVIVKKWIDRIVELSN